MGDFSEMMHSGQQVSSRLMQHKTREKSAIFQKEACGERPASATGLRQLGDSRGVGSIMRRTKCNSLPTTVSNTQHTAKEEGSLEDFDRVLQQADDQCSVKAECRDPDGRSLSSWKRTPLRGSERLTE